MEKRYMGRWKEHDGGSTVGNFTEKFSKRLIVEKPTKGASKKKEREYKPSSMGETCIPPLHHCYKQPTVNTNHAYDAT